MRSTRRPARCSGTGRRADEAVHAGHRRAAPPRQLARRDRDGPRPRDGQGAVAGADGRRRRVLAGRRRRHRLLRSDGRAPVRGQLRTGRIRWATTRAPRSPRARPSGATASASRTTRARSCLDRMSGRELWTTYFKRDAFRWESFYASRRRTANASTASPARGGRRARRLERFDRVDGSGRRARLHDARDRERPRVRRRLRRQLRAYRATNGADLLDVRGRKDPRRAVRRREPRLLLDARQAHVCGAHDGQRDRVAVSMGRYSQGITTSARTTSR